MIGIRGKKKLVVHDYTFYRFLSTKTNQTWYCSQRKGKKCRASFRFFPNGNILPVINEHTHDKLAINTRVLTTMDPSELYHDSDNSIRIDVLDVFKNQSA